MMKVFVAGATGQTGQRIVQELVKRNIAVKALVRSLEKGEILPSGVELIVGDVLKCDAFSHVLDDCTVLICATGAKPSFNFTVPYMVDFQGTNNLVNLAKSKGIEHFVLISSLCVSRFFHPLNLFWLILFWKKKAEKYLQKSGLNYTIVRPGELKNEDNSHGIIMSKQDTLFTGIIPRTKVAFIAVESLFHPEAKNQIIETIAEAETPNTTWEQLV